MESDTKTMQFTYKHLYLSLYLSLYPPDVQVPGVVLVMGDVDPVVVCDHPLVQAQDRLVTSLISK